MIDTAYLDALEVEKAGYALFGKDDRVAEVDAEIARVKAQLADEPETAVAEPAPEVVVAPEPETVVVPAPLETTLA